MSGRAACVRRSGPRGRSGAPSFPARGRRSRSEPHRCGAAGDAVRRSPPPRGRCRSPRPPGDGRSTPRTCARSRPARPRPVDPAPDGSGGCRRTRGALAAAGSGTACPSRGTGSAARSPRRGAPDRRTRRGGWPPGARDRSAGSVPGRSRLRPGTNPRWPPSRSVGAADPRVVASAHRCTSTMPRWTDQVASERPAACSGPSPSPPPGCWRSAARTSTRCGTSTSAGSPPATPRIRR